MIETKSKLPYVAGLIVALIISVGAGYFISGQGDDYSAVNVQPAPKIETPSPTTPVNENSQPSPSQPVNEKPQPSQPAQNSTTPDAVQPIPQQTGALNALDLSLGNFSIDDPESKVRQALGTPIKTSTESDGLTRLTYDAIEVVLRNGKICALVSQTSAVSTPRGIHDGSPAQEVFDLYGNDYRSEPFEGDTLYEYTITSRDGTPCWLRFAVRNADRRVDYISIRFVQ